VAAPIDNSIEESSKNSSEFTGEGVIIDIGTGDGRFKICSLGTLLEVVIRIDPVRDRSELERLEITELTLQHIDEVLTPKYAEARFDLTERGILPASEWREFNTSWAKRLQQSEQRPITYLIGHAV
jgi:hypothetical protein